MGQRQKRVYLDCTATLFSGLNTGIQRVVRNVIGRQALLEQEFQIRVVPIVALMGSFYEVSAAVVLEARPITASIGLRIRNAFDKLKRIVLNQIAWPKFMYPLVGLTMDAIEWSLKRMFWVIKFGRMVKTVYLEGWKRVKVGETDRVVLLDAFWQMDLRRSLASVRPRKVITVMFDLVPVNHPECVEEVNRRLFLNALPWVLKVTDRFLCISNHVRTELMDYCEKVGVKNKEFDYFLLGSDFVAYKIEDTSVSEWEDLFLVAPVWVMVGTIEPRKNHGFALDAFDRLWSEGAQDRLLIIGRIGWKCDELIDRIKKHPEFNKKLFLKWNISDSQLHFAYQHSTGLIFSSFAEGFGLPLVEAMSLQKRVVCSDIPIFREVGGDYPLYFSLESPQFLAEAIKVARGMPQPKVVPWLTWDQSVKTFMSKVLAD